MKRLLVTGAAGFLGYEVCGLAAREGYEVHGAVRSAHGVAQGTIAHECDLTDGDAVARLFDRIAPEGVVHLAAVSQPNRCEEDPSGSRTLNVDSTVQLANLACSTRARFVFTSTDLVFGGDHAPYAEGDQTAPLAEYGRQKAQAEDSVLETCPSAAVCRMPLMYGRGSPSSGGFLRGFLQTLRTGRRLRLFVDEYRTPASARDAARGLLRALEDGCGLYHLGGPRRVTRYEFGLAMVNVFGLDASLVEPVHRADVPMAAPRAADVSLSSERASDELGWDPGDIADELPRLASEVCA